MEILFQIAKDFAALDGRVKKLESAKCSCKKSEWKRVPEADLPKEQKAILSKMRAKHPEIVTGVRALFKKLGLPADLRLSSIAVVDGRVQLDDEDQCCMCCELDDTSGWQYCCDYSGCSTCC